MQIGVIADDFTGAIDTGVTFTKRGFDTHFYLRENLPDVEVLVLSTNSREVNETTATTRTRQAVAHMRDRRLFKKIDSTLRGNIRSEVTALLEAARISRAVICSAAIESGRTAKNGELCVHDRPIHHTAFANDPFWPAKTAKISALLRDPSIPNVDLTTVRQGVQALAQALEAANSSIVTVDATSTNDLAIIARIIIENGYLPCGSMGLGSAWIHALCGNAVRQGQEFSFERINNDKPLLIINGSLHPLTHQQLEVLQQEVAAHIMTVQADATLLALQHDSILAFTSHPVVVLQTPHQPLPNKELVTAINNLLGQLTRMLLEQSLIGGLVIVGGETAARIAYDTGMESIHIRGEIEPGVPIGQIRGGYGASLPIVTKAGGYGNEQTLTSVVRWFYSRAKGN